MTWNEEEAQKSHSFGDFWNLHIAIDFGELICQNRVQFFRNQQYIPIGDKQEDVTGGAARVATL